MERYTVEVYNGKNFWFKENTKILHRENGPAVEWPDGSKQWFKNGLEHRENGPAEEWATGVKNWWLDGRPITETEALKKINPIICIDKIVKIDDKEYKLVLV